MKAALLLVDLQHDYLSAPDLSPPAEALLPRARRLLEGCRSLGLTILHVHTAVRRDGRDAMPHLRAAGHWPCIEGSPGAAPPPQLAPLPEEPVFKKTVFSAFAAPLLEQALRQRGVEIVILAGLHLHACVGKTALDAYERGFAVWVAEDAVGSYDPLHAHVTADYLRARLVRFISVAELLRLLGARPETAGPADASVLPVGSIGGRWRSVAAHVLWEQRQPACWSQVLARVPLASAEDVAAACAAAAEVQREWAEWPTERRAEVLGAWADGLQRRRERLARLMAEELGKPVAAGRAEVDHAAALLRLAAGSWNGAFEPRRIAERLQVRRRPRGVVAAVTPWNNPVAIPAGKLGPALLFGNGVVWKPALPAARSSMLLLEALLEAGVVPGIVALVFGDAGTAQELIQARELAAVSLTGSARAGREAAQRCAARLLPLQAELGGNNAALVLPGVDVARVARELLRAAFDFAGQRCTATRRIVAVNSVAGPLLEALRAELAHLAAAAPEHDATLLGPVISKPKQEALEALLRECAQAGATVLRGGVGEDLDPRGCWVAPALVLNASPTSRVVQEESFGPLAVVQRARDLGEAIALVNGVAQGLVASVYAGDAAERRVFLDAAEAGIVKLDQATLGARPEAPFLGWKGSGLGPPEHGAFDVEFYTRVQVVYDSLL